MCNNKMCIFSNKITGEIKEGDREMVGIKRISFFLFVQLLMQSFYFYASDQHAPIEFECLASESWVKKVFDGCMSAWGDMQICCEKKDVGSKKLACMFDGIMGKLVYVEYVFMNAQKKKYQKSNEYDYKLFRNDMLYLNRIVECMIAFYAELPFYYLDSDYGACLKKTLDSFYDSVQNVVR